MSVKTLQICLKSSLLAIFLLFLHTARGQYNWTDLDRELEARQGILGDNLVAMVWKGDSLVYKKEMGGFNSKTVAPVASCSKWLTAALVMQFVDEGKISLDDKVVKYLPEFEKYFKNYITIGNCLSHMTGISDEGNFLKRFLQRKKFSTLEDEVNSFAAREIRANPGTDFWYGNVGLNIAGRILEVVSKKRFDQLIKQKLFMPLGMTKTSFSNINGGAIDPSGGAVSTADDYMKFLVMLLQNGQYKGKQVLSEASVAYLRKVQSKDVPMKYVPDAAKGFNYASGCWAIETTDAGKTATAVASPGLFGTWPMVDYCRGYAYLVFVKNLLGEERAQAHIAIKKTIDKQIASTCPAAR